MQALSRVTEELFELVVDIDPAKTQWERLAESVRERAAKLSREIEQVGRQLSAQHLDKGVARSLESSLAAAQARLRELSELIGQRTGDASWRNIYASLARSYDDMVRAAAAADLSGRFRALSPANHARSIFHMATGLLGAVLYHTVLDRTGALVVMGLLAGTFTTLELLRRGSERMNDRLMRFPAFRRIARAREYYEVNSATYYAWGLLLATFFFPRHAVEAGCLAVAFGDPLAAYAGRRFGATKLFREKSLVGALVFLGCAFLAVLAFRVLAYPGAPISALNVAGLAAFAGALAEVFTPKRLDDNLTIPLAAGLVVTLLA